MRRDWQDAALVLAAHGSARNPDSRRPTERLAEEIRRRGLFAEVLACFLKEAPRLGEALALVRAQHVYVVPNFAAEGHITRVQVPKAMGLRGPVTDHGGRRIHYAEPVGSHPRIPELLRRRVDAIVAENGLAAERVAVLIVGHGSSRPGSSGTAEAVAAAVRADGGYGAVQTAYLEQAPFVGEWRTLVTASDVIVAPLLIAEGLHGSEDLPPLFGLKPGEAGPAAVAGRRVWMCRGIGADPEIVDIILDRVTACG